MSYSEDREKLLEDLTETEKSILVERFGIDLFDPSSISQERFKFKELRTRIRNIEKKALRKFHPSKETVEPGGIECSLCGVTENEVRVMAKHESGFSICNECIELCMQVVREKG